MNIKELQRTYGNFTDYNTCDFPLDCEGMAAMQVNESLLSVLGNIGGEKYILAQPTTSKGGYVFLATVKEPTGELLYIEPRSGGNASIVYVHTDPVNINAQGNYYNGAYTKRWLKWGNGSEQFTWGDFELIETNLSLQGKVKALEGKFIDPMPIGSIVMWGTATPPNDNWVFCDGTDLQKSMYPELFDILKYTYGGSGNFFKVPNMQGKFPVGKDNTNEFNTYGKTGGEKRVTLGVTEMPSHTHNLVTGYQETTNSGYADKLHFYKQKDTVVTNSWIQSTGGGQSHNNLPPYITISFIIKVK